jgi:tRNA (guanine-N7-)-methyltransferase
VVASDDAVAPWRRKLYGRRHGKKLRPSQKRLFEELLPTLVVEGVSPEDNPERRPIARDALFPDPIPIWLEVGFGGGEHLVAQALRHRDVGLVGCEPFVNGVAMALGLLAETRPGNVRLYPGDARDLIELLPRGCLARVFVLYPDPWPKTRHHGRRFMSVENLASLRPAMADGAELRLATDIADYAASADAAVAASPGFARIDGDPLVAWPEWPGTRYEAKARRAGRTPLYLTFVRTNDRG